jgi:hypothetical protein
MHLKIRCDGESTVLLQNFWQPNAASKPERPNKGKGKTVELIPNPP